MDCYLSDLLAQLATVMATKPAERPNANEGKTKSFKILLCSFPQTNTFWLMMSHIMGLDLLIKRRNHLVTTFVVNAFRMLFHLPLVKGNARLLMVRPYDCSQSV